MNAILYTPMLVDIHFRAVASAAALCHFAKYSATKWLLLLLSSSLFPSSAAAMWKQQHCSPPEWFFCIISSFLEDSVQIQIQTTGSGSVAVGRENNNFVRG
jgi:hypothetical protein